MTEQSAGFGIPLDEKKGWTLREEYAVISLIVAIADKPTKNGTIYPAELLRKMIEKDKEHLHYSETTGRLRWTGKISDYPKEDLMQSNRLLPVKDKSELELKYERIDDKVELWHTGCSELSLQEFLGMTKEEYADYVECKIKI